MPTTEKLADVVLNRVDSIETYKKLKAKGGVVNPNELWYTDLDNIKPSDIGTMTTEEIIQAIENGINSIGPALTTLEVSDDDQGNVTISVAGLPNAEGEEF